MNYIEQIDEFVKNIERKENINVMVKNITNDVTLYKFNETNIFVSASIIKVPIMLAIFNYVLNNNIKLESFINIDKNDILYDNKCFKNGVYQYSIEDLIMWMITLSDNSSTNILIKYLGFENINNYFKEIGLKDTRLERYMLDEEAIKNGKNNYTSLNDMYKCFKFVINKEILTDKFCDLALSILYKQKVNNQINRYIKNIRFAHKTGALEYLNSDVGIFELNKHVYFVGVSVYNTTKKTGDRKDVGKLSKIIYKYIMEQSLGSS